VHAKRRSDDETAAERLEAPDRVDDDVARRDEAAIVRHAMEILPADQLKVIELAYFGGFTHVEIADMLEAPVGTVKGRMRLGLRKMREALSHGAVEA
jgi:RNA polymerase sigma-70 factor (ECF subfamily)